MTDQPKTDLMECVDRFLEFITERMSDVSKYIDDKPYPTEGEVSYAQGRIEALREVAIWWREESKRQEEKAFDKALGKVVEDIVSRIPKEDAE